MAETSGSFVVAATTPPECAYSPVMTLAAAQALRASGSLAENCVVVVPGPTIGTAGNTSATLIELNPVSPTNLGMTARVRTAFDNAAWAGIYDPDLNIITRLEDNRGNVVDDPTGSVIATQFPWHNTNVQRNTVNGPVTLSAWGTLNAASVITDNTISDSVTISLGTQPITLDGNTFRAGGTFSALGAVGSVNATGSTFHGTNVTKTGASGLFITDTQLVGSTLNYSATAGNSTFRRSVLLGTVITRSGIGGSNIFDTTMRGATMTVSGGNYSVFSSDITGGTLSGAGARSLSLTNVIANDAVINQARTNSANPDVLQQSLLTGHVVFNLTGATDGGTPVNTIYENIVLSGGSNITVTGPSNNTGTNATQISNLTVANGSTLNLSAAAARVLRCRVDAGATVNTGAFTHTDTIIDGKNKTLTAANVNRLANVGFDNTI